MDPRIVLVRRETEYESLLKEHGTPQMARFKLNQRGVDPGAIHDRHQRVTDASVLALGQVPTTWRKTWTLRRNLDRFRFDPEDVIVAVGWDGLVPNVAKYLKGQPVIGVNPFAFEQRMMRFAPTEVPDLYQQGLDAWTLEHRTMVEVQMDDGRSIQALNELFCGHQSHQSAKYDIQYGKNEEYQSSSGLIVTTGTGATGWARSMAQTMGLEDEVWKPTPETREVHFFVREAWASSFTGTDVIHGAVGAGGLSVTSKMQAGGIIFGDGIESDHLEFRWGQRARFGVAKRTLNLVM